MDAGAFTATIVMLVVVALAFDFMNGFHDAANSIATVVSTGVLKPYQAVMWAAFFNFVAIMLFHLKVAATVGKGIVDPAIVDNHLIFGALIGAIAWNVITWYYGLPSSSSHALIGGMIGSTIAKAGTGPLLAPGIIKTASFIVVAPLLGMLLSGIIIVARVLDLPAANAAADRPLVPQAAARLVRDVQHRPRQQRRAEDDGHHLAAADVGPPHDARITCRTGSSSPATSRSRSARSSAAGAS